MLLRDGRKPSPLWRQVNTATQARYDMSPGQLVRWFRENEGMSWSAVGDIVAREAGLSKVPVKDTLEFWAMVEPREPLARV